MPYALCADIHAHNWTMFSKINENGVNSRLAHIIAELARMAEIASDKGCRAIYIAGDLFHVRGSISPSVINALKPAMVNAARDFDLCWKVIPGNHDLEGRDSEILGSAVKAMECPQIEVMHDVGYDSRVAWVPWFNDKATFLAKCEELKQRIAQDKKYTSRELDLLIHVGIDGVLAGVPGHFAAEELATLDFKRVFSGHYHAHVCFNVNGKQVTSIGALTHQTFSDVGTKAGFLIVSDAVANHFESAAPKFVDWCPYLHANEPEFYKGNFVRVKDVDLDEAGISQLRRELEDFGALGITISALPNNKIVRRNGSTLNSVSIEQSIDDWLNQRKCSDVSSVKSMALDVLREARADT